MKGLGTFWYAALRGGVRGAHERLKRPLMSLFKLSGHIEGFLAAPFDPPNPTTGPMQHVRNLLVAEILGH